MEHRHERGLKQLPDGRWQFSWCYEGRYHRRIAPTKTEARAYLEKIHTQIREGRYLDKKKERKTSFEEAVERFLEWGEVNTRPASYKNDVMNAPVWLASPHFKGKRLEKITPGDVEKFRLERLHDVDRRGPKISGLMILAGRLYKHRTGKTLKNERRAEVKSALTALLTEYSGYQIKVVLEAYFKKSSSPSTARFRSSMAASLARAEATTQGRRLTKRTVDISVARLKRMFGLCVDWGLCSKNPAAKIKLFREDEQRVRYLTDEEEAKLLDACSPYLRRIVTFAIHTGMRRGEILGLRWRDVDFRNTVATIPAARAKGRRDRHVPLNSVALSILRELPQSIDRNEPVFANSAGNRNENVERLWRAALKESGVEDFRFHDLRHTFASRLAMAGVDLAALRELLGHRDFAMTLRYAHLSPSHLQAAVATLEPNLQKSCNPNNETSDASSADDRKSLILKGKKWCARRDSNPRPSAPEADALSN